jgi:nucleoside 2-deoxyribosyltransferase
MLERNLKGINDDVLIGFTQENDLYFVETNTPLEDFFPKRAYEQLERGFYNIVRSMPHSRFGKFGLSNLRHDVYSLLFLDRQCERPHVLLSLMIDEGWISQKDKEPYALTVKGLRKYEENALAPRTKNAFLAMWFGVEGNSLYREAVQKGVSAAGYHLQVVDQEEYNGFIMDKVINLINDSAFVIADLSAAPEIVSDDKVKDGVRGGVYWEAGYAAEQKKQVIVTCSYDDETKKRIHFDLQQHNQIRWKIVGDTVVTTDGVGLADAIEQRVRATVGAMK